MGEVSEAEGEIPSSDPSMTPSEIPKILATSENGALLPFPRSRRPPVGGGSAGWASSVGGGGGRGLGSGRRASGWVSAWAGCGAWALPALAMVAMVAMAGRFEAGRRGEIDCRNVPNACPRPSPPENDALG